MALVVRIETDEKVLKYKKIIDSYALIIQELIYGYKRFNLELEEYDFERNTSLLFSFVKHTKLITQDLLSFLKNKDNLDYFFLIVGKQSLDRKLDYLSHQFFNLNKTSQTTPRLFRAYSRALSQFVSWYQFYIDSVNQKKQSNQLIESLRAKVSEATTQAKNFETAIQAINGEESEKIYSLASTNYLNAARNYEILFYLLLFGSFLFTLVSLSIEPYAEANKINFIIIKIITLASVLTLGTLFLRKSAHLRKLHEQSHQTSLELKALPLYLKNINKEDHSEIYKNLVEKYFGKELDQTQNDKIGDLMHDQLVASTELIKASAEMVKAKG